MQLKGCYASVDPSFCLRFSSASPSLQNRFKSVPINGTYMGVTREEEGTYCFSVFFRHFDEKIQKIDEKLHRNIGGLYYLCTRKSEIAPAYQ